MGATLRAGVASLPADAAGAYVFLGDMPAIPQAILPPLAAALAAGAPAAAPRHEGQRGHPVLFSAALFPHLQALTGDQGARDVLRGLGDALTLLETSDPGALVDIDRASDLDDVCR
jgi:molybdenum cofactor cytidylyltransferase